MDLYQTPINKPTFIVQRYNMPDAALGSYQPSFLKVTINTEEDLREIQKLTHATKALYFHEYTHYLQDVTTTFGLSSMWHTYDRLRNVVATAQKTEGDLNIPFTGPEVSAQIDKFEAVKAVKGDYKIPGGMRDKNDWKVTGVRLPQSPAIKKIITEGTAPAIVELQLANSNDQTCTYSFGEFAVSESMAYLMEQKLFSANPNDTYPYTAAYELASFVYPEIARKDEWLFALCDLALMSPYPGLHFFIILSEMDKRDFHPSSAEDIYPFGISIMGQHGYDVIERFKESRQGLLYVFNTLYHPEEFAATREWFNKIIDEGFALRDNKLTFMLDFYRGKPFKEEWTKIVYSLGLPNTVNLKNEWFFSPPAELIEKNHLIHPIFLLAFWQLNDVLLAGSSSCRLIPFCSQSNQREIVDENCHTSPWKKSNEQYQCPFCALWVTYGFHKKNMTLVGSQ